MAAAKKKNILKGKSTKSSGKRKKYKISIVRVLEAVCLIFLIVVVIYSFSSGDKTKTRDTTSKNIAKEKKDDSPALSSKKNYILHRVKNGNTIFLKDDKNNIIEVSLYGIEAPKSGQKYSKEAENYLQKITSGKKLKAIPKGKGAGNSQAALIQEIIYGEANELSINLQMIQSGYAWVYEKICLEDMCNTWKLEQGIAMSMNAGLWKEDNPIPPWEYRRN